MKLLFSFEGRINRAKYWLGTAITLIPWFVCIALAGLAGYYYDEGEKTSTIVILGALAAILGIALLVVAFAIGIKRLHDRDKSGWWLLLFYVAPVVPDYLTDYVAHIPGAFWGFELVSLALMIWGFVELGCLRGTVGPNRFGPDPLQRTVPPPLP